MFDSCHWYVGLVIALSTIACGGQAQIIPLASYCHRISQSCSCEPAANLVRIYCPKEYAMIMQISDSGTNIAMSYYAEGGVTWLPRFDISQVDLFEFDAYNYWSDTFFQELLAALGVQKVLSVQFRDRSMDGNLDTRAVYGNGLIMGKIPMDNVSTWIFSPVPALEYFKYESIQPVLPETTFQQFDSLKTLELQLTVRELPKRLFSTIARSLETLSIVNPVMFHFDPELLNGLQELRNLSLKLSQPPGERPSPQRHLLFNSMLQLEELRLTRISNHVDPQMFKGSTRLRSIRMNQNTPLSELPSDVFADQVNLQLLDLSSNALAKLPVDLFSSLANLRLLDLSDNRLTNLSRCVQFGISIFFSASFG